MNHEIDLKKYDIHTDLVLDTIENSSLSIKSDTYNIDDIKVTKVNVDECPNLAGKYRVASIPTIMVFKNGEPVDTLVGFMPKNQLKDAVEKHL